MNKAQTGNLEIIARAIFHNLKRCEIPEGWDGVEVRWLVRAYVNERIGYLPPSHPHYRKRRRRFLGWFRENMAG